MQYIIFTLPLDLSYSFQLHIQTNLHLKHDLKRPGGPSVTDPAGTDCRQGADMLHRSLQLDFTFFWHRELNLGQKQHWESNRAQ